ncbi:MAG: hypothetical protein ACI4TT_04350 [Christensenellales bacterium]
MGKQKTNSKKTRGVVVVDTYNDNLAVVPLSSRNGANRTELKGYNKSFGKDKKKDKKKVKTYYKHYLEIEDNEGQPIRVNEKFRENHKNMDVPYNKVVEIKNTIFNSSKQKQRNKKLYDKFKNKKNDWD